jgi:hypothetical protein
MDIKISYASPRKHIIISLKWIVILDFLSLVTHILQGAPSVRSYFTFLIQLEEEMGELEAPLLNYDWNFGYSMLITRLKKSLPTT